MTTPATTPAPKARKEFAELNDINCVVTSLREITVKKTGQKIPVITFVDADEEYGKSPRYDMFVRGMTLEQATEVVDKGTTFTADLMCSVEPGDEFESTNFPGQKLAGSFSTYPKSANSIRNLKSRIPASVAFKNAASAA